MLEALRLDRQRLLDLELIALVIEQLEALQHHADHQRRFLHGELAADAGALAVAPRLEGVRRARGFGLAAESSPGSNFSASGPQTVVSRCSISVSSVTKVPFLSLYWPPITSSL